MKLLIASDIHGSAYWCRRLIELAEAERPDWLILLGDLLYHGPRNDLPEEYRPNEVAAQLSQWKDRILAVRGNCEAEVDQLVLPFPCMADYALFWTGERYLYLTHGHLRNPERLPPLAPGTVFLSGHTHRKQDITLEHIRCLNPGSVSLPKDGTHSCLILRDGAFSFHIFDKERTV